LKAIKSHFETLQNLQFRFGLLPIVASCKILLRFEQYELIHSINEFLKESNFDFDHIEAQEDVEMAIVSIKIHFMVNHGLTGDIYEKNLPFYVMDVLGELKQFYK